MFSFDLLSISNFNHAFFLEILCFSTTKFDSCLFGIEIFKPSLRIGNLEIFYSNLWRKEE